MSIQLLGLAVTALTVAAATPVVLPNTFDLVCDDGSAYRVDLKREMWCDRACSELKTLHYRGGQLLDLVVEEHSGVRFDLQRRIISVGSYYPGNDEAFAVESHCLLTEFSGFPQRATKAR